MLKLHQGNLLKDMSNSFMSNSNPIPKCIEVPLQHKVVSSVQHIYLIKAIEKIDIISPHDNNTTKFDGYKVGHFNSCFLHFPSHVNPHHTFKD
jgi:hypothetical protein